MFLSLKSCVGEWCYHVLINKIKNVKDILNNALFFSPILYLIVRKLIVAQHKTSAEVLSMSPLDYWSILQDSHDFYFSHYLWILSLDLLF